MPRRYGYRPSLFVLGARVRSKSATLAQNHPEGVLWSGPEKLSAHVPLLPGEPDQNVWQVAWDRAIYQPTSWYPESILEVLA